KSSFGKGRNRRIGIGRPARGTPPLPGRALLPRRARDVGRDLPMRRVVQNELAALLDVDPGDPALRGDLVDLLLEHRDPVVARPLTPPHRGRGRHVVEVGRVLARPVDGPTALDGHRHALAETAVRALSRAHRRPRGASCDPATNRHAVSIAGSLAWPGWCCGPRRKSWARRTRRSAISSTSPARGRATTCW